MKAIILAAGIASRLRPLTNEVPKCLLEIGGKKLLQRTIDGLVCNGIDNFVIVTGYRSQQIENFVRQQYSNLHVTFIHNKDYESTNNIYSLWLAKEQVAGSDVLLLDSDIIFDPKIVSTLLADKRSDSLALNRHELGEEEIKVIIDQQNRIVEINKTCRPEDAVGESIGIEKMSKAYLETLFPELDKMILKEGLGNVFYEKAFERLASRGVCFVAIDTTSLFSMELDTVDDFNNAIDSIPGHLL